MLLTKETGRSLSFPGYSNKIFDLTWASEVRSSFEGQSKAEDSQVKLEDSRLKP